MPRCSIILTFFALLSSGFSYAQSLGEVAREIRAEKQTSRVQQSKVVTNEDLEKLAPTQEGDVTNEGGAKAPGGNGKPAVTATTQPAMTDRGDHPKQSAMEDRNAQERERQRRTEEINQSYMYRIAMLRDQIHAVELELAKLQESYETRWDFPLSDIPFRESKALLFNRHVDDVMEEERKLIANLKSQLAATQEEARHAGVPHATD
jgi:hypothetical protein